MFRKQSQANLEFPPHLAERLVAIGEDPESVRWVLESDGIKALERFVEGREQRHSLYREWAPRLFEFVEQCRKERPGAAGETLSETDRAKLQIYETIIRDAERVTRGPNCVNICQVPLLGIPVAQRLWPGEKEHTVILTPEEKTRWYEIYHHKYWDDIWWFVNYWWSVDDPDPAPPPVVDENVEKRTTLLVRLRASFSELLRRWNTPLRIQCPLRAFGLIDDSTDREIDLSLEALRTRLQEGEKPLLAISGLCWGEMHGGEKTNLWAWNGRECRYVYSVQDIDF